jgi:hypothetical protein
MIATELYNSTFYRFYADHELFSEISQGDVIVFYEVETEVRQRNEVSSRDLPSDYEARFKRRRS